MLADRMRMRSGSKIEYVMAEDSDFSGTTNGTFKYIGTGKHIIIPNVIKGVSVTSYANMFADYAGTQLKGVASFNNNIIDMNSMFYRCLVTTLDLSSFDTSEVKNMYRMFFYTRATSLDLSSFDTSKVSNMEDMFRGCYATSLNFSSFNVSSVNTTRYMFMESKATSLDLSSFDTSNVQDATSMFWNSKATTGYARTQADADLFNATARIPAGLTFIVKP